MDRSLEVFVAHFSSFPLFCFPPRSRASLFLMLHYVYLFSSSLLEFIGFRNMLHDEKIECELQLGEEIKYFVFRVQ